MLTLWIALGVLFVIASGFYSGSEMGFYCVNRVRLRLRAAQGDRVASRLQTFIDHPQQTILVVLAGTNIANYLATVFAEHVLRTRWALSPGATGMYLTAVLAPILFVFGDVVPKNWFQREADRLMSFATRPLQVSRALFRWTGLLVLIRGLSAAVLRLADGGDRSSLTTPRRQMIGLLREGVGEGVMTAEQSAIVDRVMGLTDVPVGRVMIPRKAVTTVPVDATREAFEGIVRRSPHSRLPVIRGTPRQVLGFVDVGDVLADERHRPTADHLRPLLSLSPRASVAEALVRMQRAKAKIALVEGRGGDCVGIVTLKDLVEEIVGELAAW